jgi:hypothetical protein
MKRIVPKLDEDDIRRLYRIPGRVAGWFFRVRETSQGAYTVDGTDLWGRRVSRSGIHPDALLAACQDDAEAIVRETTPNATPPNE